MSATWCLQMCHAPVDPLRQRHGEGRESPQDDDFLLPLDVSSPSDDRQVFTSLELSAPGNEVMSPDDRPSGPVGLSRPETTLTPSNGLTDAVDTLTQSPHCLLSRLRLLSLRQVVPFATVTCRKD